MGGHTELYALHTDHFIHHCRQLLAIILYLVVVFFFLVLVECAQALCPPHQSCMHVCVYVYSNYIKSSIWPYLNYYFCQIVFTNITSKWLQMGV